MGDRDPKDVDTAELEDLLDAIESWDPAADSSQTLGEHLSGGSARSRPSRPLYVPPVEDSGGEPDGDRTRMFDLRADPEYDDLLRIARDRDGEEVSEPEASVPAKPARDEKPQHYHRGEPVVPGLTLTIADDGSELVPSDVEVVEVDPSLLGVDVDFEEILGDILPTEEEIARISTVPGHAGLDDPATIPFTAARRAQFPRNAAFSAESEPPPEFGDGGVEADWAAFPTFEDEATPATEPRLSGDAVTPVPEQVPAFPADLGPDADWEPDVAFSAEGGSAVLEEAPVIGEPSGGADVWAPPETPAGSSPVDLPAPGEPSSWLPPPPAGAPPRWVPPPSFGGTPGETLAPERGAAPSVPGRDATAGLAELIERFSPWSRSVLGSEGAPLPPFEELLARVVGSDGTAEEPAPRATGEALVALVTAAAEAVADPVEASATFCEAALVEERRIGDPGRARDLFARAAELDERSLSAASGLRRTAIATGELAGLEPLVERELSLALSPAERVEVLLLKAELHGARLGDSATAVEALREASRLAPEDLRTWLATLELSFPDGEPEEVGAAAVAAAALVDDGELRGALSMVAARRCEWAGESSAAVGYFEAAASQTSGSPAALAGMARGRAASADLEGGAASLAALAEVFGPGPAPRSLRRRAAAMLLAGGQAARALEFVKEVADPETRATVAACAVPAGATALASRALWELASSGVDPVLKTARLTELVLLGEDLQRARVRTMLEELTRLPEVGLGATVLLEGLSLADGDVVTLAAVESGTAGGRSSAARAGVILSARGRPGDARRWFAEAAREPGSRAEAGLVMSTYCAAAHEWDGLAALVQDLGDGAETTARRAAAMLHLGFVHELRLGDRVAARAAFAAAGELDEGLLPALDGLVRTAPDEASRRQACLRAAEVCPGRLTSVSRLVAAGRAAEAASDIAQAAEVFAAAFAREPSSHLALAALERVLRAQGGFDSLADVSRQSIEVSEGPAALLGRLRLGRLLLSRGAGEEAEDCLWGALEQAPSDRLLAETLVRLAFGRADRAAVAESLERLAGHLPAHRAAQILVAAAELWESEDDERALACLERARGESSTVLEAGRGVERLLVRLERRAELEALVVPAEGDEAPSWQRVAAHQRLAQAAASWQDDDEEARQHEAVVKLAPDSLPSLHRLASHYLRTGDPAAHLRVLEVIAETLDDPRDASAVATMALRLRAAAGEDPLEAMALVRLAAFRNPRDLRAAVGLYYAARVARDDELTFAAAEALAGRLELPRCSAVFSLRAADALERLGRREEATERLLRAGRDGGHPLGFWRASRLAEGEGSFALAAETAESAAESTLVPEQKGGELLRAARLWLENVEDARRATIAIQKSLAASPNDRDAHELAKRLMAEGADPRLGLELATERLATATDQAETVELGTKAAALALQLGERAKAKEHLRAVLQADPEHRGTLLTLVELCAKDSEWAEAAQCHIRLARLSEDGPSSIEHFFQLGVIYHEKQPDHRRAIQSFRKVLSLDESHVPALRRLSVLLPLVQEWQAASELTARLAELEVDGVKHREALILLARSYEEGLGDARRAEQALEGARREAPTDLDAVEALAAFYRRQGAGQALVVHLDRAATDFRRIVDENPCDVSAYRALSRVYSWRGADDAARCAATVLATFGQASHDEQDLISRLGGMDWAPGPSVADIGLDEQLAPSALTSSLRALFAQIGDAAIRLKSQDPRRLGLARSDKLSRGHRVLTIAQAMAPWYGLRDVEVWLDPRAPGSWDVLAGTPPAIVVGAGLAEQSDEAAVRFLIGRAMALLQRRLVLLTQLEGHEAEILLPGVVKLVYPGYETEGVDEARLAEMTRELGRLLGKRQRQEAGPFALECVGDLRIVPGDFRDRALELADRAALLASGSLPSAVHALQRLGGASGSQPSGPEILRCIAEEPRSGGLLRFFVSPAHIAVRERLGLAAPR